VINAGPAAQFYSLASGSITVANLTHYFLTNAFPNLNDLYGPVRRRCARNGDASYPSKRSGSYGPATRSTRKTTPWNRQKPDRARNVGGKIDGIATGR